MGEQNPQRPDGGLPALQAWEGPAILLVDLDAFFASVEQLDHPAWRGKPVIVGGDPDKRGVVSTASYEARPYGVHSGMPASTAKRLCPDAIWTHGRFDRYREISDAVMGILRDETPFVQQVSIDEAFMDVTPNAVNREHPVDVARRIQDRVEELGVSCSVGVGSSKSIAKIASEMDKPRGLTVVFPGGERDFLDPLPVRSLSGVGAASEQKLHEHGIDTLGELARADEGMLERLLGKNGRRMWRRANGLEDEAVEEDDEVKSISSETTFAVDLTRREDIEAAIGSMAAKVGRRLRRAGLAGRCLSLKLKYDDLRVRSVQRQLEAPSDDDLAFTPLLCRMLDELWNPGTPVRLVGVAMGGFDDAGGVQERLFEPEGDAGAGAGEGAQAAKGRAAASSAKRQGLLSATDQVKERFGEGALRFGSELRNESNTTGTAAKNPSDYRKGRGS